MRWKIRTKIITSTVCIVSLSLLVSGFFTYNYATDIIRDQSVQDSQTQLAQIASQLQIVRDQVVKTAEYIISDEQINVNIRDDLAEPHNLHYFRKMHVQEELKRFTALNAFILNAMIVREDGETYSNNPGYEEYFYHYLRQPWFTEIVEQGKRTSFSLPHDFFYLNRNQPVFSYIVSYRNLLDEDSPNFYLVLDVRYSEIEGAFQESVGDFEQLLLLNAEGNVMYDSGQPENAEYSEEVRLAVEEGTTYEDRRHIVLTNVSANGDWKQVAVISKDKLFANINKMLQYMLLIAASSIAAVFITLLPIILNITRPISKLVHAMKRVSSGVLQTHISIRSGDEMEVLASGFNHMVDELRHNVEASIRHEEMKRTMQISLLMSQINPHFIYNTLNTVIYLSYEKRSQDVVHITEALIAILQDTIRTGEGQFYASLDKEMQVVQKYIEIQHYRYPERFTVSWQIPPELRTAQIPRMVLQPLVENALFHGIIPGDETGSIVIAAQCEDNHLIIEVSDDGVGMDEATQQHVLNMPTSGKRSDQIRGIGLKNIQERLVFHFGQPFGLTILSEPGAGTRVRIRMPYVTEAEQTLE